MSHFSTIQVQIKNGVILQQVLTEMGYRVEQNTTVRGYQGITTQAEYVIRQSNGYDLGFRRQGDNYELVADFWGAKVDQKALIDKITQKYAHQTLITTVQQQGFNIESEQTLEDGTIQVVVGRWV